MGLTQNHSPTAISFCIYSYIFFSKKKIFRVLKTLYFLLECSSFSIVVYMVHKFLYLSPISENSWFFKSINLTLWTISVINMVRRSYSGVSEMMATGPTFISWRCIDIFYIENGDISKVVYKIHRSLHSFNWFWVQNLWFLKSLKKQKIIIKW